MCYTCGCKMRDNDMGNPDNLTTGDFEKAAHAANIPVEEAKKNAFETLKEELGQ